MSRKTDDVLREITPKITLQLEYKGKTLLQEKVAKLLYLINKKGSILSAAKSLGITYSRAWDWISKVERTLGMEVVHRRRGGEHGGGTTLTETGKKLLDLYLEESRKYKLDIVDEKPLKKAMMDYDIFFAGSHDPVIEKILEAFTRKTQYKIEISWVGSTGGFLSVILGEVDVAGCHLYDPETGEYNLPYLKMYHLLEDVIVVRGFSREISLAYDPSVHIKAIDDLVEKNIRVVNRNPGSGTRILFDSIISEIASRKKVDTALLIKKIRGYDFEVKTHSEAAEAIKNGKADAGLILTYTAKKYGLDTIPLRWEIYDIIIPINKYKRKQVKNLVEFLKSSTVKKLIEQSEGYKVLKDTGRIIHKPRGRI